MYAGVDVGGSKVLVAALDDHGVIKESKKFPTPKNYHNFLLELRHTLAHFEHHDFVAGGAGIPVTNFNRNSERAYTFSNLPWHDVAIQHDLEKVFHCPFVVENDAKMASLSEAMMVKDKYSRVLYVTISTGIGYGLTVDGKIDPNLGDGGGRTIMLSHRGQLLPWESFASGRAIVERYGKRAEDIHDQETWKAITRDLTLGFLELIAITQPDVVIVGGSVGTYFDRFKKFLADSLEPYATPLVPMPVLKQAERPEQAVIYGCYDLAKAIFSHKDAHAKVG